MEYQDLVSAPCLVWYFFREDLDRGTDYASLCTRPLALLRPGKDLVVLADTPENRSAWLLARQTFHLDELQAIWRPYPVLPDDATEHQRLAAHVKEEKGSVALLVPYVCTRRFREQCRACQVNYVGDPFEEAPNKSFFHSTGCPTGRVGRVLYKPARGGTCSSGADILAFYQLLSTAGVRKMLLKPACAQSGAGIIELSDVCSHAASISLDNDLGVSFELSPEQPWVLEELVELEATIVLTMFGPTFLSMTEQIADKYHHLGNHYCPGKWPEDVRIAAELLARDIWHVFEFTGPWGLDVGVVTGADSIELIPLDLNAGRFCGGHYPTLYFDLHGVQVPQEWSARKTAKPVQVMVVGGRTTRIPLTPFRELCYEPDC